MKRFVFLTSFYGGGEIAVDPEFVISVYPIQLAEFATKVETSACIVKIFDGSNTGFEFTVCEGVKEVVKALEGEK